MWVRRASLNLLFLFLLVCTVWARLVNISIDDTYGDLATGQKPVYQPTGTGSPWYYSANCVPGIPGCYVAPDTSLAFNGTWTAGSYDPLSYNTTGINITLSFTGVSIWLFFIISNTGNATASTGSNIQTFSEAFDTAIMLASSMLGTGLDNSQHELVIWTKGVNQTNLIFDYAIYTGTQTAKTYISSSNLKLKTVIGCALGGLALIALLLALAFRFRRSRRAQKGVIKPILAASFNHCQLPVSGSDGVTMRNTVDMQQQNSASHNENPGPSEGIITDQHAGIVHSHSFDSTGRPARLVPFRQFQSPQVPNRKGQDELRAERQMEINQHLQTTQQEMQVLTSRQSAMCSESDHNPSPNDVIRQREMEIMREQIHHLNTRMEHLHMQLSSDWAQGLSDEPPPAYYY
ncbi:hypothetical protein F5887DRAFT_925011 [Amanita rubescens]|nr:hypothetical protein F5887DRAFT_925011 [Amanita rubescens]